MIGLPSLARVKEWVDNYNLTSPSTGHLFYISGTTHCNYFTRFWYNGDPALSIFQIDTPSECHLQEFLGHLKELDHIKSFENNCPEPINGGFIPYAQVRMSNKIIIDILIFSNFVCKMSYISGS